MIDQEIYKVLLPIKFKTIEKIKENLKEDPKKLNIIKSAVPTLNVYSTFERTFSTHLGYALQEVAAKCGESVVDLDKEGRELGIDLRTLFGEGQLKSNGNTQTGTHTKDSINKLLETTSINGTNPFFAVALGKSYDYIDKNGVLRIGGKKFWEKIGVEYDNLYDTIVKLIQDTYDEVERTIIPTL